MRWPLAHGCSQCGVKGGGVGWVVRGGGGGGGLQSPPPTTARLPACLLRLVPPTPLPLRRVRRAVRPHRLRLQRAPGGRAPAVPRRRDWQPPRVVHRVPHRPRAALGRRRRRRAGALPAGRGCGPGAACVLCLPACLPALWASCAPPPCPSSPAVLCNHPRPCPRCGWCRRRCR